MTTAPVPSQSAANLTVTDAVALLTKQTEALQTAVHTALRQNIFHNRGRLMNPRLLPQASQLAVQSYLQSLQTADPATVTEGVETLVSQGLGHLTALAVTDTLNETSLTLLPAALPDDVHQAISQYHHQFLHQYMVLNEKVTILAREKLYQNVQSALEKQTEKERRLRQELQAVAEVGAVISGSLDLAILLQEVVDLSKEHFDLYHAQIYLLNETGTTINLTAGAGEVGQKMVAQSWHISLDKEQSLVARVARTRKGAVINNVHAEPDFLANPLLPETQSELAVPIIASQQLIGVLDVQTDHTRRFSAENVPVFNTLAAQIGAAVQNARLFAKSEAAQRELSQLTRRLIHEGWQDYLAQQEKPQMKMTVGQASENGKIFNQSLRVQGEEIGQLLISDPKALANDTDDIMSAVAERLSSHIENLRLSAQTETALAQTEQQAERLSILNEMSAALSNCNSFNDIYQVTALYTNKVFASDHASLTLIETGNNDSFSLVTLQGTAAGNVIDEHLSLSGTAVTHALQERRIVVAPQDFPLSQISDEQGLVQDDILSFICAPLMIGEQSLGTLNIGSYQPDAYSTTDIQLMQQIVSLLAATLESQRLFEATQRRANREAMVNEISQKIQNAPTIETAMQTAVSELGKALGIQRAVVKLNKTQKNGQQTQ